MTPTIFLGLDPGSSGGLAVIDTCCALEPVDCEVMPKTEADVWKWIKDFVSTPEQKSLYGHRVVAVVERVGGFMGASAGEEGGEKNRASAHTMFKFGRGVGVLVGCLIAAGIPFEEISPQTWQKEYGMKRHHGEKKPQWKGRLKACAQKLFPDVHLTLNTCDAVLLAEYARRKYGRKQ